MTKKISSINVLRFLIVFLFLLFKYIEMWSFLITETFYKSKIIMILFASITVILYFKTKISKQNLKNIAFITILSLIITALSGVSDFIISFLIAILYCSADKGDKEFLKNFLISSLILFVLTILLSVIGILPEVTSTRYSNGEYISRNSLGFYGANSLFLSFYPIIISYIVLYFKDNKKKNLVITLFIAIIAIVFYKFTDCRAGILCVLIALFLGNCDKIFGNKIFKKIMKYYFILFFILSLLLALKFGDTVDNPVSKLGSGRTYYWNYYVENVGWNLFGTTPLKGHPLDNIYLQYFYIYGFISFICYFAITVISAKEMVKSKKLVFLLLAFAIYGFFENNVAFNINFVVTLQLIYIIKNKCSISLIEENREVKEIGNGRKE